MSRRAKFAFITWIGPSVSPLKKAKVSTDKAFVKAVWPVSPTTSEARVSCTRPALKPVMVLSLNLSGLCFSANNCPIFLLFSSPLEFWKGNPGRREERAKAGENLEDFRSG